MPTGASSPARRPSTVEQFADAWSAEKSWAQQAVAGADYAYIEPCRHGEPYYDTTGFGPLCRYCGALYFAPKVTTHTMRRPRRDLTTLHEILQGLLIIFVSELLAINVLVLTGHWFPVSSTVYLFKLTGITTSFALALFWWADKLPRSS